ncbi:MAG TPA: YafY family protein [Gammaproteobacteria bacterium]|nr:YafY family protein [Gammaproteobacteria bacterium]
MRRADRLFAVLQFLRSRRLTTARWLADKLEVSTRTVYRDIADLIATGVPIEGEAGVGYVLRHKLDLPPLMFDRSELAAIELGLRFAAASAGPALAVAAASAASKVRTASPRGQPRDSKPVPLYVPASEKLSAPLVGELFAAIEGKHKLRIRYEDLRGQTTSRVIWPLGLFFWSSAWTALAWCELRTDFRNFRLERIGKLECLKERYADQPGRRLADYFQTMAKTHAVPVEDFDPL